MNKRFTSLWYVQVAAMASQINKLTVNSVQPVMSCDLCLGPYASTDCQVGNPFASRTSDQVNYVQNFNRQRNNPYFATYNSGWKNHSNFSLSNQQQGDVRPLPPGFQNRKPGYQSATGIQFSGQQEKKSSVEDLISAFMSKQDALMSKMDTRMDVQESTLKQLGQAIQQSQVVIQNLEVQVGQLARSSQSRAQGALPSNTETNPKEHCMALTLRSGKQVDQPVGVQEKEKEMSNVRPHGDNLFSTKDKEEEKEINKEDNLPETSFDLPPPPEVMAYVPPIPYPQRLKKYKDEKSFKKFLEVFKKLHINIPFVEALAQMPTYVNILKEIISNKRRLEDFETVTLTEECSAIILNKLPPKLKDPGNFIISYTTGNTKFGKALCDLGASINLMPLSFFKKLGLEEVKSTNVTLQLADRSVKYPYGIVEDVLVKVNKLYFPMDFMVLEMEEDVEIPLILGRPFLATSRALIDVHEGKLTLRVRDEEAIFNVFKARKIHTPANTCFMVDLSKPTEVKEFKGEIKMSHLTSA
ncbi:hypothetical protein ACOSP7_007092 [Xanthoceras sorbifolium]